MPISCPKTNSRNCDSWSVLRTLRYNNLKCFFRRNIKKIIEIVNIYYEKLDTSMAFAVTEELEE